MHLCRAFYFVLFLGLGLAGCRQSADEAPASSSKKQAAPGVVPSKDEAPRPESARKPGQEPLRPGSAPATPPPMTGASAKEVRERLEALLPPETVQRVVNPAGSEAYSGPTGVVRGRVISVGDLPLALDKALEAMAQDCTLSRQMFATVPREGKDRTLADAFVAVTGYNGFLPAEKRDVVVTASGCAWDQRTVGMTFGQNLQIRSGDRRPYVPELLGQSMPAQLFVLPNAAPVNIPPRKLGQFRLVDSMRLFNLANVIVVSYPTFDVTGLDGFFEIKGIPVGKVQLNALLPETGAVVGKEVEVVAGAVTEVTLELRFDAAKMQTLLSKIGSEQE